MENCEADIKLETPWFHCDEYSGSQSRDAPTEVDYQAGYSDGFKAGYRAGLAAALKTESVVVTESHSESGGNLSTTVHKSVDNGDMTSLMSFRQESAKSLSNGSRRLKGLLRNNRNLSPIVVTPRLNIKAVVRLRDNSFSPDDGSIELSEQRTNCFTPSNSCNWLTIKDASRDVGSGVNRSLLIIDQPVALDNCLVKNVPRMLPKPHQTFTVTLRNRKKILR